MRIFDKFVKKKLTMINKVVANVNEACKGIESGMTLMLGGFGLCGIPENCIQELVKMKINNLVYLLLSIIFCRHLHS